MKKDVLNWRQVPIVVSFFCFACSNNQGFWGTISDAARGKPTPEKSTDSGEQSESSQSVDTAQKISVADYRFEDFYKDALAIATDDIVTIDSYEFANLRSYLIEHETQMQDIADRHQNLGQYFDTLGLQLEDVSPESVSSGIEILYKHLTSIESISTPTLPEGETATTATQQPQPSSSTDKELVEDVVTVGVLGAVFLGESGKMALRLGLARGAESLALQQPIDNAEGDGAPITEEQQEAARGVGTAISWLIDNRPCSKNNPCRQEEADIISDYFSQAP